MPIFQILKKLSIEAVGKNNNKIEIEKQNVNDIMNSVNQIN